jgi:hypothetical protein
MRIWKVAALPALFGVTLFFGVVLTITVGVQNLIQLLLVWAVVFAVSGLPRTPAYSVTALAGIPVHSRFDVHLSSGTRRNNVVEVLLGGLRPEFLQRKRIHRSAALRARPVRVAVSHQGATSRAGIGVSATASPRIRLRLQLPREQLGDVDRVAVDRHADTNVVRQCTVDKGGASTCK